MGCPTPVRLILCTDETRVAQRQLSGQSWRWPCCDMPSELKKPRDHRMPHLLHL